MLCLSGFELYPRWVPLINAAGFLAVLALAEARLKRLVCKSSPFVKNLS